MRIFKTYLISRRFIIMQTVKFWALFIQITACTFIYGLKFFYFELQSAALSYIGYIVPIFYFLSSIKFSTSDYVHICIYKNTNVPLILKLFGVIFFTSKKHIMGHFWGFFKRASTLEMPHYVFCQRKENLPLSESAVQ